MARQSTRLGLTVEWSRPGFETLGFTGWKTFGELTKNDLPRDRGVYVVMTSPTEDVPVFLSTTVAGTHKGKSLAVEPALLSSAWRRGAEVLYIGKAGGARGLRDRLWAYAKQGRGRPAGHQGGRYIWHLPESQDLVVAWRATPDHDSHDIEEALLSLFIEDHGDRPFANLKDGYRYTAKEALELLAGWSLPSS